MLSLEQVTPEVRRAARTAVVGGDRRRDNGPLAKVGMELAILYHQHQSVGAEGVRALEDRRARPKTDDERRRRGGGRVVSPVDPSGRSVFIDAVADERPRQLLADLRRLGLREGATAGNAVSGRLPISAIREAAQLESLRGMMPSYARIAVGSVGSEADTSHFADQARANTGVSGSGQKVCALSDSYNQDDQASTSAADDVQSGDLPGEGNAEGNTTPVDVLQDDVTTGSDEGRAMLQLIHDIAPGAELGFHTAFGGIAVFASGIRELADAGCTVIVDDVGYSAEPFYQDGPVSNAADEVVTTDGVPYFSSAGNNGQDSYEAPFRNSGQPGVLNAGSVAHDFNPSVTSVDTRQTITINEGGTFRIFSLQWTDPSALVEGSRGADTDLDVALLNDTSGVVTQATLNNDSLGVPVEFLEFTNTGNIDANQDGVPDSTFALTIEKADGPDPDEVKYIYTGSGFTIKEYDTLGPTVFGHPMAEGAHAVAAAPFYNTARYNPNADPATLESFSSKGGIPILFDQSGNRLTSPEQRAKPDITGTDGIDNTFFGSDISDTFFNGIDADPHPNFFGTSAAAPNIAAVAALIRQARPDFAPTDVYSRLDTTAQDVTERLNRNGQFVSIASGEDPWSGHGFVRADDAVPEPIGVNISSLSAEASVASNNQGTVTLRWAVQGQEASAVDRLVVARRFFDEPFAGVDTIDVTGNRQFTSTVENLQVGAYSFRVQALGSSGSVLAQGTVQAQLRAQRASVSVYPNPFVDRAEVSFTLPDAQDVRVVVYDVLGRRVATLFEGERPADDPRPVVFDAGRLPTLGSGVYFFRVQGEDFTRTVKAVRVQ